ncbi:MAG: hypothetical protein K2P84_10730, partial [Undibacterium sp.]|nr:hypothetical protein [Undibacterium sp.]
SDLSSQLSALLRQTLPDYMIPAAFMVLDHLPLNANGKLDRKALPEPDQAQQQDDYLAPRTATETLLCQLWQETLGLERVGVNDNFFRLGGHSLLAVKLVTVIGRQFGVHLPMAQLFTTPSIAEIAVAMNENAATKRLAIIMQRRGTLPPLFLIHPGGGGIFCYSALVAALGVTRPIYGIQDAHEAGIEITPYEMDTIAERYVEEILAIQAHGPYVLAGWSLGGLLAFKMTHILEQLGHQVQAVFLLDSSVPQKTAREPQSLEEFIEDLLSHGAEGDAIHYETKELELLERIRTLLEQIGIAQLSDLLRAEPEYLETEFGFDQALQVFLMQKHHALNRNSQLLLNYSAKKVAAPVHLFWAEDTVQSGADVDAWNNYIDDKDGSSQHFLPGKHVSFVMGESLQIIAKAMRHYLEQTRAIKKKHLENEV